MSEGKRVQTFLDHNDHVGLSFYATDAADIAANFTEKIRELSGDLQVVVLVRTFQVTVFREVFEPLVVKRHVSVRAQTARSRLANVRVDYRDSQARIARSWLEFFLARSALKFDQPEARLMLKRAVAG